MHTFGPRNYLKGNAAMSLSTCYKKIRQTTLAATSAICIVLPAHADDLDVYNAVLAGQNKPNILFVLDYSGSMKEDVNGNLPPAAGESPKIAILKTAVNELLDRNTGRINAGIGSLYSYKPSGVRWPVSDLAADAHSIDADIPAGLFTVRDIIGKQLNRMQAYDSTSTVNALAEAALYFQGAAVPHNNDATNWPDYHEPDTWDTGTNFYNGGYRFSAMPSSYQPQNAYVRNAFTPGQLGRCSDYSISGGTNHCASFTTHGCVLVPGGPWNSSGGEGSAPSSGVSSDYMNCNYDHPDRWDGATYVSPITQECQVNAIILVSDGNPTVRRDNTALADALTTPVSGCEDLSTSIFSTASSHKSDGNCGPELVSQMANNDQIPSINNSVVATYTVGFSLEGPGKEYLRRLAADGNGAFYEATQPDELTNALNSAIDNILGGSHNFVELAIDVDKANFSHDNRAVFSLFTPSSKRSWDGNIKGYFVTPTGLVDTNGNPAIVTDASGARFDDAAQSFWSILPDGNNVTAGGASELLTTSAGRDLYTYTSAAIPVSGMPLAITQNLLHTTNANLTDAMLGLPAGSPDRAVILDWIQTAPMGDPLHSNTVMVNYASKKVVYSMTNQGLLHAFDITHPTSLAPADHTGGDEIFAFMPQELLKNMKDIYNKNATGDHIYGLDGSITRWHQDHNSDGIVNGADKLMLVLGMRRGGNSYYALDVTNPNAPRLEWRIEGGTANFPDLAQSWSRAALITVKTSGVDKQVLMFSGGYDAAALDAETAKKPAQGNAIYMVDQNGDLIWSTSGSDNAAMQYSIASDLTVIDSDANGLADRAYVGDLGGQVWRIDFNNIDSAGDFEVTLLADVNSDHQPFFYPPSVALNGSKNGDFLSVTLGSGNRTQPLLPGSKNAFFMLRDTDVDVGPPAAGFSKINLSDLYDATANDLGSTTTATANAAESALDGARGWTVNLGAGEKSLSTVVSFDGNLLATTFEPTAAAGGNACNVTSMGRLYLMDIKTAKPVQFMADGSVNKDGLTAANRVSVLASSGIPSSPVIVFPKGSSQVQIIVDKETVSLLSQKLSRVYWHSK